MASSSTRKQCANDNGCKQAAVTNCEGCSKAFCIKHFSDHCRLLDEEMNVIIDEHDHLKNTLNEQTTKPDSHSLMKEIVQWEKESIVKIQQRAKELRQELLQSVTIHESELSRKLHHLSEKLKESRENDSFIETDLQDWKKTLYNLKTDLASPSTISISQRDNVSLVQNITLILTKAKESFESVSDLTKAKESFESVSDNKVRIEENRQVAVRDNTQDPTEVRGKNEYASGCHEIRLRIENFSGRWMFLGINSKLTLLQNRSFQSKSSYGWSTNNYIWLQGLAQSNHLDALIAMEMNDVITLILDCDNRRISMINERTKIRDELIVNIDSCPFPWQLHVNLYEKNGRVRIV